MPSHWIMSLVAIWSPRSSELTNSGWLPIDISASARSTRGHEGAAPLRTSTVNSTSIEVSTAVPSGSPSPCSACPSPTKSSAPGW